jgi:hypothetical protein
MQKAILTFLVLYGLNSLISFKKICKFHSIESLEEDPFLQKKITSLLLIHLRLRIEPHWT